MPGLRRVRVDRANLLHNPPLKFNAPLAFFELPLDVGEPLATCLAAHSIE